MTTARYPSLATISLPMALHMTKLILLFSQTLLFLDLLSLTIHATAVTLGNQTDKLALLEFKSQLTDDPLGLIASWNDSIHFCRWKGVTCGLRHQRVTGLDISGMNLPGTISPHIGNLSFLATLNLAENFLTGIIPPEFGRLARLRNLNLSFNFIGGGIPVNISRCTKLVTLALNHNNLTHQIPPEIGTLSNLVILYLRDNNLTGRIPASFGNLSSIQQLVLTQNSLQGEIPDTVAQMRSLTSLGVALNNISGGFPPPVYNLSSLRILSLSETNLQGELRSDIGLAFPNLQIFYLGGNRFTGVIPASFSNASNLQELSLTVNSFIGNIPPSFENLQALSYLNVGFNGLGSGATDHLNFLTHLANCSRLEYLDFSSNHFGGELPSSIANLSRKLTWLNGYGNSIRGNFPTEIASLISLINLDMGSNSLTGTLPASLGRLSNLVTLSLGENHFTGEIPFSFENLSRISYLDLHNNSLGGSIPSYFGSFRYLQVVKFCHNRLNGTIPKELVGISSLSQVLNVSHNSLTGFLPEEVGNLNILVALDVSYNSLSGNIPNGIGNCLALEQLYMQGNSFQGPIPDLSRLRGLQFLDLSSNNLHGQIPMYMSKFSYLQNLNLSFNNLEGEVPTGGVFDNASAVEIYGNNHLCGPANELHLPPCAVQRKTKKHIAHKLKLAIIIVSPCFAAALLLLLLLFIKKATGKIPSPSSFRLFDFYPKISYNDLLRATDGFSSSNLIGSGSFGSVYEGSLGPDKKTIAVKVLNLQHQGASKSFKAECQALRNIRHRNLVRIITICSSIDFEGNDFRALVYEFMPSGSLEMWLHPVEGQIQEGSLSLLQRISIAVDVASALNYLHHQCRTPVVHCDLKPSNILLDSNLTAHVSDFGLARIVSKFSKDANSNHYSSFGIKGSIGYAAPEYGTGDEISTLGDVYSFGILLLEMFTGKRPTEEAFRDNCSLHNFVKLALPDKAMDILDQSALHTGEVGETAEKGKRRSDLTTEQIECIISVFGIGVACSAEHPRGRISMRQVCWKLLSIKENFMGASNSDDRPTTGSSGCSACE